MQKTWPEVRREISFARLRKSDAGKYFLPLARLLYSPPPLIDSTTYAARDAKDDYGMPYIRREMRALSPLLIQDFYTRHGDAITELMTAPGYQHTLLILTAY